MTIEDTAQTPDARGDRDEGRDERKKVGEVEDRQGVLVQVRGGEEELRGGWSLTGCWSARSSS